MKFVLAPIDFSPVSARVLETAEQLAARIGAHVVVLHVLRRPEVADFAADYRDYAKWESALEAAGEVWLEAAVVQVQRDGVPAYSALLDGMPAEVIVEQAEKLGAVYVVMGSHGHTPFHDLVMGSTVGTVVKRAVCPVVVVPAANLKRNPVRAKSRRRFVPSPRL